MFTGGINATVLGLVCSLCLKVFHSVGFLQASFEKREDKDFFKGEVQISLM